MDFSGGGGKCHKESGAVSKNRLARQHELGSREDAAVALEDRDIHAGRERRPASVRHRHRVGSFHLSVDHESRGGRR